MFNIIYKPNKSFPFFLCITLFEVIIYISVCINVLIAHLLEIIDFENIGSDVIISFNIHILIIPIEYPIEIYRDMYNCTRTYIFYIITLIYGFTTWKV